VGKRNFDPPEGRKTPTPGSKSMVEGPTKVLRVFRALLYNDARSGGGQFTRFR